MNPDIFFEENNHQTQESILSNVNKLNNLRQTQF